MASWREVDRIRKAPAEFRAVAKRLLNIGAELTEWESNFLESICNETATKEFTTRQSEKLLQIRDDYETITTFHGLSVETLLDKCWLGRFDLSESREQKLQKMRERSHVSVRRKYAGFLMRHACELQWRRRQVLIACRILRPNSSLATLFQPEGSQGQIARW